MLETAHSEHPRDSEIARDLWRALLAAAENREGCFGRFSRRRHARRLAKLSTEIAANRIVPVDEAYDVVAVSRHVLDTS
ncbi:hypothetical protein [Demequina sp. NBRC 110054]|uniref:hypothetical protein n=1 Tax=Demequina sp. NBRC 110054 TaxID=1570343 RepID=UPI001177EA3D|nr:hypothetical protein [Demequina sp. NBRC 110054]